MTAPNPYEPSSPPLEIPRAHPVTTICDLIALIFAGLPLVLLAVLLLAIGQPDDMDKWEAGFIFLLVFVCVVVFVFYAISAIYNLVGSIMGRRIPTIGLILNALSFGGWALESWLH